MTRTVTANLAITLDGRYHGPAGPGDLGAIVPYAITDLGRDHLGRIHENATTALFGRRNAEGFLGFWPSIATNEEADPRDRAYAKWLADVEKVVLSTTLTESPWDRARVVNAPAADVVTELKASGSGEILVNSSVSVIKALLAANLLDRLYLLVTPEITGGGTRLFDDGLPATRWTVARHDTGALGETAVIYDRVR
ncbi:dihydrofolate reductase family protein [Actinokineospora enzanensis]|uniref:dihydrofolate reductase family protein n=1 Tax=Actinokineospora enzanensis TaxID=155975 RepID=UPI00036AE5B1|nr:dihydrofolate reductase family protein [Actinokineospora enzanensis]